MKLHEEFKEYENLWDDSNKEVDPVDQILNTTDDFELEYDGFEVEWYEDHFDPSSSYGHYQTGGTDYHPDFTYKVNAINMFETLRDDILPKHAEKVTDSTLVTEYRKLAQAWENSTDATEAETGDAMELYIAKNLEELVDTFIDEILEHYKEEALEWAHENW